MTLQLYDTFATVTRRLDNDARVEYAVDPGELAGLLATNLVLHSDFLPPNTLWICKRRHGGQIATFRPPQPTGIWLEGVEAALHVPLPGLILVHDLATHRGLLFAVQATPHRTSHLYAAPLPNVSVHGSICWGTVAEADLDPAAPNDLGPIWRRLFGSAFINHDLAHKSRRHPADIRRLLLELHEGAATEYPLDDLQPAAPLHRSPLTLADLIRQEDCP